MRILITGGTGLLGRALIEELKEAHKVYATFERDRNTSDLVSKAVYYQVDLRDHEGFRQLFSTLVPDVVIHTAGIGSPDFAESHKDIAWSVNVRGTRVISDLCEKHKSKLIYVSSNGIYDGDKAPYKEDDHAEPVNFYGWAKLAAEKIVKMSNCIHAIVRPNIMYGWHQNLGRANVVTFALSAFSKGETFRAFEDIFVKPLYVNECAKAIKMIIEKDIYEDFNIAGAERMSIYDLVSTTAKVFGYSPCQAEPVHSNSMPALAQRPKDTSFCTEKMEKRLGILPLELEEGLRRMSISK